ncbi:laccase [Suillus hirtellus]|nr:laccase [Suillus hirtellus]
MFILFLVVSLISSINATSIVSRSQSYPLSQPAVHGPKTGLFIGNGRIAPDGYSRSATLVNGAFPGTLITGKKGDKFEIDVVNKLYDDSMFQVTSVHWHGINQNKTNYADGASNITQCPITPDHSFSYSFSDPNQAGTFWYHSHYSVQYCDGLRGPLIIYDPEDPWAHLYDVDDASTVITFADWYHDIAPKLQGKISFADSMLINGIGHYYGAEGRRTKPAVITVTPGKRYRLRLIQMSCETAVQFSIDGHSLTIIEADGELTQKLVVDRLQILAGQRYSVILNATQPVDNYWVRGIPNYNQTYNGSAILRYEGATETEPTTVDTPSTHPLRETDLHALINPVAPGIREYGKADINITLDVSFRNDSGSNGAHFYVNGATLESPSSPVLSQILNGTDASQLEPHKSMYVLGPNKVVEVTIKMNTTIESGGPHPMHLHGHSFYVVQSADADDNTFNYENPVRRDVVSTGIVRNQTVIRWVTDNSGPWFLHCHIDWHLDEGFGVVMAESPQDTPAHVSPVPHEWGRLCPIYNEYVGHTLTGSQGNSDLH